MKHPVYKVVRQMDEHIYHSTQRNAVALDYMIGVVTNPIVGKLFAFRRKKDAYRFINDTVSGIFTILRGTTSGRPITLTDMLSSQYVSEAAKRDIEDFWRLVLNNKDPKPTFPGWLWNPPQGTIFIDDFLPLAIAAKDVEG